MKKGFAGNNDAKVRSDCFVSFELTESGGIDLRIKSKVQIMYGKAIEKLVREIVDFYEVKNAIIEVDDKGALDFTMAARVEAAIRQALDTTKEYLLPVIEENKTTSLPDQYRFSRLYLPGNTPSMMLNAGIHKPNGIILDLEDAVAHSKKYEARFLVRNALRSVNFYGAERMVRINQVPAGIEDLKWIVPHHVNLILIPKCENAEQVRMVEAETDKLKKLNNLTYPVYFMPIIESALGVENAFEIANASPNVTSLAIGLEDFTADLGVKRTKEGTESLFARMRLVNACKAARKQPIDSVFSDVGDMDALAINVKTSKSLGFEGMGCIHPRQIPVIHTNFAPDHDEIEKAKRIELAFDDATTKGLGVVSLGTKMIDPPVVKRAQQTIKLAVELGILPRDWKELLAIEAAK
ncbi:MAG: citrate lyase acyl carrier protein [Bacteroidetes bacterium HGW-Bacteroidetes-21]|jgi:citrate lyase subunit beta/citryl-CoA lyase|nr:MAG: citrate lyase acyl carrier protein [Bacteroidetes bacterium HGW-Bacteroidetes-21]